MKGKNKVESPNNFQYLWQFVKLVMFKVKVIATLKTRHFWKTQRTQPFGSILFFFFLSDTCQLFNDWFNVFYFHSVSKKTKKFQFTFNKGLIYKHLI